MDWADSLLPATKAMEPVGFFAFTLESSHLEFVHRNPIVRARMKMILRPKNLEVILLTIIHPRNGTASIKMKLHRSLLKILQKHHQNLQKRSHRQQVCAPQHNMLILSLINWQVLMCHRIYGMHRAKKVPILRRFKNSQNS